MSTAEEEEREVSDSKVEEVVGVDMGSLSSDGVLELGGKCSVDGLPSCTVRLKASWRNPPKSKPRPSAVKSVEVGRERTKTPLREEVGEREQMRSSVDV